MNSFTAVRLSAPDLIQCLAWRYAVKRFDAERKIPSEIWQSLIRSLVLSPSSYGLQPWRFIDVVDPQLRQLLLPAAMGQRQVVDCAHLVVFAARTTITASDIDHWLARLGDVGHMAPAAQDHLRQVMTGDLISGPRHAMVTEWAKRQTYLALGGFLTAAAVLGIDACPMEGFSPAAFDDLLGLPALGYGSTVIATVGYRSSEDRHASEPKVRYPLDEVVLQR
jgi:nitroreductase